MMFDGKDQYPTRLFSVHHIVGKARHSSFPIFGPERCARLWNVANCRTYFFYDADEAKPEAFASTLVELCCLDHLRRSSPVEIDCFHRSASRAR
jgi:hypothetical protein